MIPMNHREIEVHSQIYWDKMKISVDNINGILKNSLLSEYELGNDEKNNLEITFDWIEKAFKEVTQEDLLMDYGKDCIRLYLFFEKKPRANDTWLETWEECSLEGCYKFLSKYRRIVLTLFEINKKEKIEAVDLKKVLKIIELARKESIFHLTKSNTMPNRHNAVAVIMESIKELQKELHIGEYVSRLHSHEIEMAVPRSQNEAIKDNVQDIEFEKIQNSELQKIYEKIIMLMTPFAPYLSEELWQITHTQDDIKELSKKSVLYQKWNQEDMSKEEAYIIIPVQVNSKTRKRLKISASDSQEQIQQQARKLVEAFLPDKGYIEERCIYIPDKLINFVYKV